MNNNVYNTPSRSLLRGCPQSRPIGKVFRSWWNWKQAPFCRCLRSMGSLFQVVVPTTEKERLCIVGTTKSPSTEDRMQCTTTCIRRESVVKLSHIGGRTARLAPPHQGRDLVWGSQCNTSCIYYWDMWHDPRVCGHWSVLVNPPMSPICCKGWAMQTCLGVICIDYRWLSTA